MKYQNSPYPCHHYQKATDNHGNHKIHSCDALPNLASFVQFKKREKHSWRSVNFSKVAGCSLRFAKINTPPWVFFTFFK